MAVAAIERHRFTVEDFERMAEVGLLREGDYELVDGAVVRMSPRGDRHSAAADALNRLLIGAAGDAFRVSAESVSLPLTTVDMRDPDFIVSRTPLVEKRSRPSIDDIVLLIEVSDSSLAYELGEKLERYAAAGVAEYWVVDLPNRVLHVFRAPDRARKRYVRRDVLAPDASVAPEAAPGLDIAIASIFG